MIDELRSEELQLKRRLAKIRLERALERRAARQLNIKWEIALGVWGTLLLVGGVAVMFGGHYSSPPPRQPITTTPTTVAPTTTPTCRIGPQTRGCTWPDGPCSYTGPCVTETIPSPPPTATGGCIEGETPQGRCLTNPDGYITALKTHGFTITDFNATITYGAKVCDLLANRNLESVVDYLYATAPDGTYANLDVARLFVNITYGYLCSTGSTSIPPSPTPTPKGTLI